MQTSEHFNSCFKNGGGGGIKKKKGLANNLAEGCVFYEDLSISIFLKLRSVVFYTVADKQGLSSTKHRCKNLSFMLRI